MNLLVMVIDDSPTVRKILAVCLHRADYEVICFADGIEAIRWLTHPQPRLPALLILDIGLSKIDGYEVVRYFKTRHALAHIAIIILTGRQGMLDRLKGRLCGAQTYLTKPFQTKTIVAVVEAHVGPSTPRLLCFTEGYDHAGYL